MLKLESIQCSSYTALYQSDKVGTAIFHKSCMRSDLVVRLSWVRQYVAQPLDTVFFFNLVTQPITPPFMTAPLSWIFVKIITIYFLGTDSLHFAFHQLPFLCLLLLL
ncbi:unnamed protein product [Musa acuminata var. zebrina]